MERSLTYWRKMLSTPTKWASLMIFVLVFAGCDHETEPPDGPNLIDRFGPFAVVQNLQASATSVDFSAGENIVFTAEFNKNVDWVLTITGTESGSVKIIEGFDRFVNASNATWIGGTTQLPLFKNEVCTVELTVPEEPDYIDTLEVEIIGTRIYPGNVFWDFEEDGGSNIEVGNFEFEFTPNTGVQTDNPTAAQGNRYWLMEGTDNVVPNFFVGLINMSPMLNGVTYAELPTTIPSECYFNFFLHNDGRDYGIAVIQFAFDSNDSGEYEDGQDATFQLEGDFPLDFNGWRKFSHTMADVGMSAEQLEKIVAIRVLLISNLNAQPNPPEEVRFGIDFMIFTQGSPLVL